MEHIQSERFHGRQCDCTVFVWACWYNLSATSHWAYFYWVSSDKHQLAASEKAVFFFFFFHDYAAVSTGTANGYLTCFSIYWRYQLNTSSTCICIITNNRPMPILPVSSAVRRLKKTLPIPFIGASVLFPPGGVLRFRMGTDVRPGIPTTTL